MSSITFLGSISSLRSINKESRCLVLSTLFLYKAYTYVPAKVGDVSFYDGDGYFAALTVTLCIIIYKTTEQNNKNNGDTDDNDDDDDDDDDNNNNNNKTVMGKT